MTGTGFGRGIRVGRGRGQAGSSAKARRRGAASSGLKAVWIGPGTHAAWGPARPRRRPRRPAPRSPAGRDISSLQSVLGPARGVEPAGGQRGHFFVNSL
jgi:hypothetical protein